MTDREYQIQNLQRIIDGGLRAPFFRRNPKYPIEGGSGAPRITYSDVMAVNYVIRIDRSPEINSFWNDPSAPVLASYDSIEALVDDGWRLD